MGGVKAAEFRQLLGRFATGVTVLTVQTNAEPLGMTASSVASVSLDPPLLLVCVDRASEIHDALLAAPRFALNVLAADQEALSRRFAGSDRAGRFDGVGYQPSRHGVPLLDGALAHIECEKQQAVPAGDHTIFVGLVTGGDVSDRPPLLYYRGGYSGLR